MSDLDTTIEYYKDLILYQYINTPKATETIKLLTRQALVDLLPISLSSAFDIDTAIGSQLDILGEYIGFDRVVQSQIIRDYFTLQDEGNVTATIYGMTDYNNLLLNANYSFYSYVNALGISSSLSDDEYRLLLKLKLHTNISRNSLYEITTILYEYFSNDIVLMDQCDMTMSYFTKDPISRIIGIAYTENLLPKPMGVELTGVFAVVDIDKVWSLKSEFRGNTPVGGFIDYNLYYFHLFDSITLTDTSPSPIFTADTYAGFVITTPNKTSSIKTCEFYIKQGTNVANKVYAALWSLSVTDEPVNNLTIDSTGVDVATGVSATGGWVKFTFDDEIDLLPSTRYGVMLYTNTAENVSFYYQTTGPNFPFLYNPGGAGWAVYELGATIAKANIFITEVVDDEIFLNYEDKL